MHSARRMFALVSAGIALAASAALADGFSPHPCGATTRTYMGGPGTGPYGPGPGVGQNPWTGKLFGLRCCKTPETRWEDYQRRLSVVAARNQVRLNRVEYHPMTGNLMCGKCGCNTGCGSCGGCGDCGDCFLFGLCNHCKSGHCGHGGPGGYPPGVGPLPAMNREDATRYIEGMQYYPPYQLLRSPRDFYMFDVKYGIGR